ncbi:MAG: PEGA domain-containing protein [bacterium]|nr:PEGA domain-containing protein [bacterium]
MKEHTQIKKRIFILGLVVFLLMALDVFPLKVKVIVDKAKVKATPEIGGNTIARLSLNTILDADSKQDEWYKIYIVRKGVKVPGYIHQMMVGVTTDSQQTSQFIAEKTPEEITAELNLTIADGKRLIRVDKDFAKAIEKLRPLVARLFKLTDAKKQKELATEIYLWVGIAYSGQDNDFRALEEFKNMFEVDYIYTQEITRNIYEQKITLLVEQARKHYLGIITEYSLEIATIPKEAKVKFNGKDSGTTPEVCTALSPRVTLEIEKTGYKTIKEELFLTQSLTKKEYKLESLGRNIDIHSKPTGAKVLIDGTDTTKISDCQLPYVKLGTRKLELVKENYAKWEKELNIEVGVTPIVIDAVLTVKNYGHFKSWGGPDRKFFQKPAAITVDKDNNFYIADTSKVRVRKFNSQWQLLLKWVDKGDGFRKAKVPGGIAVDNQGYIFLTDTKGNSILKFDKKGKLIKRWGKKGNTDYAFLNPSGIAADSTNNIYIADSGNHIIKKYSQTGVFKKSWGKRGSADGSFISPTAIAVNSKNEVYVIDVSRIQKFSAEGLFIASWGKAGTGDGEFYRPGGIFVDSQNYLYVADSMNNRIQKFDENGKFISKWGSKGSGNGQFTYPSGIAVDSNANVLVVERDNNRLQGFTELSKAK